MLPEGLSRLSIMKFILRFLRYGAVLMLAGCALAPVNYQAGDAPQTAPVVRVQAARPVVGLVLGAGGSRGFAHIGVIKSLEMAGIRPDLVVGVSSGAVVGALYAAGMDARALESAALDVEDNDLIDFTLFGPAMVEGARLQDFINHAAGNRPIEKLPLPFAAVAAENGSNRMAVFNRGNTGIAVRASASVPRLFWPVIIRGTEYVDGGLASRVPVSVARDMGADIVIAVDVSRRGSSDADAADVVIRPEVIRTRITDFSRKLDNLAAGEAAAHAALPRLRTLLARFSADAMQAGANPASARH
jgi:NTE family protein